MALELERGKPQTEPNRFPDIVLGAGPSQPRADALQEKATREAYEKMIRTAYELALNPQLPLSTFKLLLKCQRMNGVRLIEGKDDCKATGEFFDAISKAVTEKVAAVVASQNAMSLLSDGSQARKTKSDKEMVLVRVERNGIPVYFVVSLLEMSEWGGTNAEALKRAIDSIFGPQGNIPLTDYLTKLVSCTADGASVNMGHISGLLTRLGHDRDWMLKIHCANHRIELAVKAAFKDTKFAQVDEFYQANFNLLRNSGKLKSAVQAAASAIGIEYYVLSKLTGTRFVGHRSKAYKRLLDM